MKCPSCDAQTLGRAFCPSCGKIAPRPPDATHFDVFGLPRRHAVDGAALERQFRELSLKLHPDRFARADAKERRSSLEQTTALNDAYKTLKDPARRAFYLLKLHGVDLDQEEQGPAGDEVKRLTAPPVELLEQVIELREALHAAKQEKDLARAQAMGEDVAARKAAALKEATAALDALEASPNDVAALASAAQALMRVRYFARFLEEVAAIEEEALA